MLRTRNGEGAGYLEPKQHNARGGVTVMLLRQKRKRQEGDDGSTPRHKLVPALRVHRSQTERLKSSPGASESGWNPTTRNFLKQCSSESALEGPRSSSALPCPALHTEREREIAKTKATGRSKDEDCRRGRGRVTNGELMVTNGKWRVTYGDYVIWDLLMAPIAGRPGLASWLHGRSTYCSSPHAKRGCPG